MGVPIGGELERVIGRDGDTGIGTVGVTGIPGGDREMVTGPVIGMFGTEGLTVGIGIGTTGGVEVPVLPVPPVPPVPPVGAEPLPRTVVAAEPAPDTTDPAPAPALDTTEPAPAATLVTAEPAPETTLVTTEPAPAAALETTLPAPAPALDTTDPAPAAIVDTTDPAPAATVDTTDPAPAATVDTTDPAPSPTLVTAEPTPDTALPMTGGIIPLSSLDVLEMMTDGPKVVGPGVVAGAAVVSGLLGVLEGSGALELLEVLSGLLRELDVV